MEKRVIAAIALSIAILFGFRYYEERFIAKPAATRPAPAASEAQKPPATQTAAAAKAAEIAAAPLPAEEIVPARQVVVESELYRAVIDSRGGVLTSFVLKNFKTDRGESFDMIPKAHMEERPFPGSLSFDDPALTALATQQNYVVEAPGQADGSGLAAPAIVVMRLRRGDILIEKKFSFEAANYLIGMETSVVRGNQPLRGRLLLGQDIGPETEHLLNPSLQLTAAVNLGGKIQRESAPKDEKEVRSIPGDIRWVGLDMQYFALVAVPGQALSAFEIQRVPVKGRDLKGQEIARDLIRLTLPWEGAGKLTLYLGPKSQSHLAAVHGDDVAAVIDYGAYLGVIVKPLLIALRYLNRFTNNFGWAIILLTFLLTFILMPFRIKQMVSMKKMQVLQPKIKEIQERYKRYKKTDPKRADMNREVMAVYKENKVNPLGGCMPLLLQMPFLFAFYRLLSVAIELRHAPFLAWMQDLSAKDPYYILPIVMGITMLISQKMTPMSPTTDPMQAKMMMIMPIVMTVFFLNVSSGLNLYFLCSNVFQVAFQKIAERWIGDQQPAPNSKNRG